MKDFLKRMKLIDNLSLELPVSRQKFVEKLSEVVAPGSTSAFSGSFEAFSRSSEEYRGRVDYEGFSIRRRRRFFERNKIPAVATGRFTDYHNKLIIDMEIVGFHKGMWVFVAFLLILYPIFLIGAVLSGETVLSSLVLLPFILLHACLMIFLPYFAMRRSVKRMKHDLEREFHFLAQQ